MNSMKKILFLSANPLTTPRLRLDKEVREIREGLRRATHRSQFDIQSRFAVRIRDLRRSLLDEKPQIVHFSGHGKKEGLFVEDEQGMAALISSKALAGLFELFSSQVECVILNACYSASQAKVISKHIKYVIGMKKEINDEAATEFAVGFYDALGAGKSVEEAFKFGCNAVQMMDANLPTHLVPILRKREDLDKSEIEEGEWSTYTPKGNTYKVALMAHNDKYVAAVGDNGGTLTASSMEISERETFYVTELPEGNVYLQVYNGQYMGSPANRHEMLTVNPSSPDSFEMISLKDDRVAFQTRSGGFVSVNHGEGYKLTAAGSKIRAWEIFRLIKF